MLKDKKRISNIPTVLWGDKSDKLIIAVHGNMSNKEDVPITMLAEHATKLGYQLLSFDLPEHGERQTEATLCKVQNCVSDLTTIMEHCQKEWNDISLFAVSMGAYFSLIAYRDIPLSKVWFLSPVVNMELLIDNMMKWFSVTEEQLKKEQTIPTPIGQTLYWDYYTYVKEHPVTKWDNTTYILYGTKDDTSDFGAVSDFTTRFACDLKVIEGAEHYFHTPEQLTELDKWYNEVVI